MRGRRGLLDFVRVTLVSVFVGLLHVSALAAPFLRGDADGDGQLRITDPISTLGYLFLGSEEPGCLDALDTDDGGTLNLTDAILTLTYLFLGGPSPAAPFPDCGLDPTDDGLGCGTHRACGARVIQDPGGASVTLPQGAIDEGVEITVTTFAGGRFPGSKLPVNGAAEFGPEGTRFAVPVLITIPCALPLAPGSSLPLLVWDPDGSRWTLTEFPATVAADGLSYSAEVTHFSVYTVGPGADVFGDFSSGIQDCEGPGANLEDLFWDWIATFLARVLAPGEKFVGTDGNCYEVNGIEFDIAYGARCGGPGGTLSALAGNSASGDESIEFRQTEPGVDGQGGYDLTATVWLTCLDPELTFSAERERVPIDEEGKLWLFDCNCGAEPMFPGGGEPAFFLKESGPGEVDPVRVEMSAGGSPRAETTYKATDFGKAKISANVVVGCGSDPEPHKVSMEVDIEVTATAEVEYDHHLRVDAEGGSQSEHVTGSIPIAIHGESLVGGGGVDTRGSGSFDECSVTIAGSAVVIATGQPATDGSRRLRIQLDESWTKTLAITCGDETDTRTVSVPSVVQPIELPYEDGAVFEQPFQGEGGSGTYRWTLRLPRAGP